MKSSQSRNTLSSLVSERLATLGATNIPNAARELIESEVLVSVAALIQRRVTAPVVGRAVSRALAAPAASDQGLKGGTPLTSTTAQRSWQPGVAGHTTDTTTVQSEDTTTGGNELSQKSI
jgi:hypothetical protein